MRLYHDARSREREMYVYVLNLPVLFKKFLEL